MDMTMEQKPIKREVLNKSCVTHTSGLSYSYVHHIHQSYAVHIPVMYTHTHTHVYVRTCIRMYQAHHTHMIHTRSIKSK